MAFYKQDIVDINLNTGSIFRSFLNHSIGFKNDDADRFGIRCFRDGEPVDLSGASCQAVFMAPNGVNIALTSYGTVSGNVAYVTLPPACYDYEGQFCLSIQLVGGGVTGTMRIVDGMVVNTGASGAVAPTASVPTYQEIISQYNAMVAATSAANLAIAETFDATKAYPAGKYVINDGHLYRLTADHAANVTWANTSKVTTNFGDDLSSLKSELESINNIALFSDNTSIGELFIKNEASPLSIAQTVSGYSLLADGHRISDANSSIDIYNLTGNGIDESEVVYLKAGKDTNGVFQFQTTSGIPEVGTAVYSLVGITYTDGYEGYICIPKSAKYLIVSRATSRTTNKVYKTIKKDIDNTIESINNKLASINYTALFSDNTSIGKLFIKNEASPLSIAQTVSGYSLLADGHRISDSNSSIDIYNLTGNGIDESEVVYLKAGKDTNGVFQFQTTSGIPDVGTAVYSLVGITYTDGYEGYVCVPKGAKWLIVSRATSRTTNKVYKTIKKDIDNIYASKNLIGLDSTIYYPVVIPTGTTLTMSTADGAALGQMNLTISFYDEDKNEFGSGGWSFNYATSERTFTVTNSGRTAYYVKWNTNPIKAVQLEIGSEKTAYTEYSLPINDPAIIKQILNPVPDGLTEEDIFNGEPYSGSYDWQTPVVNYGALFKEKTNVETFAFFTDPHIMGFGDSDRNETNMQEYIKKASKVIRSVPCKSTVCGGDWLNNNTTMDEACYRLGYIKALAKNMLCDCKLVNGNHDTNYQGKRDSESEVSTGRLTDATIAALMFNDTDTRKAYYSFDGIRSKCYVLDTGIEHSDMNAYDWEQIAWLAGKLAEDDSEHSIIFLHIITNNGNVQTNTSNFATLVEAYNEHTTVTLNSITYDFTSCTGKVELWVGGHTHIDSNGTLGGIPYIITASLSYGSYVPLIDLMLVDYDNHVLRTIRAGGTGSDRAIALAT